MLNIPGYNRDHAVVITCFKHFIDAGASFLLPLAAVYEAGNHVGRIRDGNTWRPTMRALLSAAMRGAARSAIFAILASSLAACGGGGDGGARVVSQAPPAPAPGAPAYTQIGWEPPMSIPQGDITWNGTANPTFFPDTGRSIDISVRVR